MTTRECLGAIPDTSISGKRMARELTMLVEVREKPRMIVFDNVPSHLERHPELGKESRGGLARHRT